MEDVEDERTENFGNRFEACFLRDCPVVIVSEFFRHMESVDLLCDMHNVF